MMGCGLRFTAVRGGDPLLQGASCGNCGLQVAIIVQVSHGP
jgi:hypothetical protein